MDTESLVCRTCKAPFTCTLKWRKTNGHWCHACRRIYIAATLRKYRKDNPERVAKYKAQWASNPKAAPLEKQWAADKRQRWRTWLDALKDKPCHDCGNKYHSSVMEYDHIGTDKVACIGHIKQCSKERILAEIAKCELVCANCHRLRTHLRREAVKQNNKRACHSVQSAPSPDGGIQPSG